MTSLNLMCAQCLTKRLKSVPVQPDRKGGTDAHQPLSRS
jgi:hypothetical protein